MTLNFTRNTQVTLFGNAATVDDLRVGEHQGQRVEADYDPSNNDARTFDVVQASLNEGEVGALLGQVLVGEIEGTIRAIDRSAVVGDSAGIGPGGHSGGFSRRQNT